MMNSSIIICDDSSMARKQVFDCLPDNWDVAVHFAADGFDCLNIAAETQPELIFLDLNMPELDGYQTLEECRAQGLNYPIIVISGDIQPEAQAKVSELGAIDFIKKPIDTATMRKALESHGFFDPKAQPQSTHKPQAIGVVDDDVDEQDEFIDCCQEIANVAMGRAGDLLARFLNVFIRLPVPKVNYIELSELTMALRFAETQEHVSAVCQGFIGSRMSGEALLIFNDSNLHDIANLMGYKSEVNDQAELELLMDMANILIGACLQGLSDQLDVKLGQSHPQVLGQHAAISDLIKTEEQWRKTLSIEISYSIENSGVNFDLLLLFTDDCVPALKERIGYLF